MNMDNMNISTEETEENRKRKKKNCSQQKKRNRIFKTVGGRAIFHATGREREREREVSNFREFVAVATSLIRVYVNHPSLSRSSRFLSFAMTAPEVADRPAW